MDEDKRKNDSEFESIVSTIQEPSAKRIATQIFEESLVPAAQAVQALVAGSGDEPSRIRWDAIKFVIEFAFGKDTKKRGEEMDWEKALSALREGE